MQKIKRSPLLCCQLHARYLQVEFQMKYICLALQTMFSLERRKSTFKAHSVNQLLILHETRAFYFKALAPKMYRFENNTDCIKFPNKKLLSIAYFLSIL